MNDEFWCLVLGTVGFLYARARAHLVDARKLKLHAFLVDPVVVLRFFILFEFVTGLSGAARVVDRIGATAIALTGPAVDAFDGDFLFAGRLASTDFAIVETMAVAAGAG